MNYEQEEEFLTNDLSRKLMQVHIIVKEQYSILSGMMAYALFLCYIWFVMLNLAASLKSVEWDNALICWL